MTVSSTAIVFTRYILLEWLRRKKNDDKTICELFYVYCDDIQDMELPTTLKQLLELLANSLENKMITITSEVKSQLINWFVSQPAFIQALCPDFGWEVWRVSNKLCISLKLPSGIISNPRKPVKAGRLTLTGFRGFKDGF